ncbi:MAG: T9SS type A sorting domain-containing protein [Chitinophagaceae bacterium]
MKKTIIRTHACLALFCAGLGTMSVSAQVSSYAEGTYVRTGTEAADQLRSKLSGHFSTRLKLRLPEGMREFRVRASTSMKSGEAGTVFYEGTALGNSDERIRLMMYNDGVMVHYLDYTSGRELILAKDAEMEKTGIKQSADQFLTPDAGGYSWLDRRAYAEHIADAKLNSQTQLIQTNDVDNVLAKETAASDNITLPSSKSVGWIGKRDVFISLYNYNNSLTELEMFYVMCNCAASLVTYQSGSGNINPQVYMSPYTVNTTVVPFNTNASRFLDAFKTFIGTKISTVVPPPVSQKVSRSYGGANNEFHLLVQKGYTFTGSRSAAEAGGRFSVSNVNDVLTDAAPSRALGFNFNALSTSTCNSEFPGGPVKDVMYDGSATCPQALYHTAANRNYIASRINSVSLLDEVPVKGTVDFASVDYITRGVKSYTTDVDTRDALLQFTAPSLTKVTRVQGPLFDGQVNQYADIEGTVPSMGMNGDRIAVYKVRFHDDGRYVIKTGAATDGTTSDTYLYLLDGDGEMIAADDDGGGEYYSAISGDFLGNRWYYVIVGGYLNFGLKAQLLIRYMGPLMRTDESGLDMGNGNTIYAADFGASGKSKVQPQHPVLASGELARVFPNPVASGQHVTLYTGTASHKEYAIYNTMGVRVMNGSVEAASAEISLQGLASGDYMIRVADADGKSSVQHIIVQ